jgi:hypothetical protein
MELMYSPIIANWASNSQVYPTSFLVACLASVVHHSDWLQSWSVEHPGHPFSQVPILLRPDLLEQLKAMVTTELGGSVTSVTGIPPHIECAQLMRKCVDLCESTLQTVQDMVGDVKKAVSDAIEDNAVSNGQVSAATLQRILGEHEDRQKEFVETKMAALLTALQQSALYVPPQIEQEEEEQVPTTHPPGRFETLEVYPDQGETQELSCYVYEYDNAKWHVPQGFEFPRNVKLENGWKMWLLGLPIHQVKGEDDRIMKAPIRPFRFLEQKHLPPQAKNRFKLHWVRIFQMMMEPEGAAAVPLCPTMEQVQEGYERGMLHLHKRMGYVFLPPKNPSNWEVATWCKHAARSFIEKHGTEEDKANLPAATKLNNPRRQPVKRNRPLKDDHRRKVPRRNPVSGPQEAPTEG